MSLSAMRQGQTLFGRILLTIGIVSVLFQVFTLLVIGYHMLVPLGMRSADDLVSIMQESVHQWHAAPLAERENYKKHVWEEHGIKIQGVPSPLSRTVSWLPYLLFVEASLKRQLGSDARLLTSEDSIGETWYWMDMPVGGETVRVGFPESRIGVHPPFALFIVLSVGGIVILLTTVVLARRISRPLERISDAAGLIGKGRWPEPLPENGSDEIAALAVSFNRMSQQIQQLLANRTTLLAGISHDLRSPLARMRLAVAMLPEDVDDELKSSMERDLEEMNKLIGQFLHVGRGLGESRKESVNIPAALLELAEDARRGGAAIEYKASDPCQVSINRIALCRVVANLLDNAVRYGSPRPVRIDYRCSADALTISISDRGPGIPEAMREAVFEPFYRIESSRNIQTGGSGLGLAIAKQLAQANGWELTLSEARGGGTVAEIRLPVHEPLAPNSPNK